MSALQWILVVVLAIGTLATVLMIGKERKPITPGQACFTILVNAALLVAVLVLG